MVAVLEDCCDIVRFLVAERLEFLAVTDFQVRAHIIGTITQVDLQALVSEDFLLLSKDWVSKFGVECRNRLEAGLRWRKKSKAERIIRAGVP